jgi:sugar lactone lactonase YvrE
VPGGPPPRAITEIALLCEGFAFAEAPRWGRGRLWVADARQDRVVTVSEAGEVEEVCRVEAPLGLGFLPDGDLLISSRSGKLFRFGAEVHLHADLRGFGQSLNDMVVGPGGQTYVACHGAGRHRERPGWVLHVSPDGATVRAATATLRGPNGMAVTPDGAALIVNETFGHRVWRYRIEGDGSLTGPTVFADLPARTPDGLCLDAEGAAWIGSFETGEFLRVLDGGPVTDRIDVAPEWAVAPMLGGPDRRTLFLVVTTGGPLDGRERRSEVRTARAPAAGAGWP